jgi:hypothetical protein
MGGTPMRPLLAVIILAFMTAAAAAQTLSLTGMPTTLPLIDNSTKERIGTATLWDRKMVLRRSDGTFIAQIVIERDGTRTMLDEHGKPLEQISPNIAVPKVDPQ